MESEHSRSDRDLCYLPCGFSLPDTNTDNMNLEMRSHATVSPEDVCSKWAPSTPTRDVRQQCMPKENMSPCYRAFQQFTFKGSPDREENGEQNCLEWPQSLTGCSDFLFSESCPEDQTPFFGGRENACQTASPAPHRRALFSSIDETDHPLMFPQISLEEDHHETMPPPYTPVDILSYFRDQRPSDAMQTVHHSPEKDHEICSIIMDSYHTKNIDIVEKCLTDANLKHYTIAAEKLNVKEVKDLCERRCVRQLQKDTCLELFQIAVNHNCPKLLTESMKMICEKFGFLWQTDVFQNLGGRALMCLLDHEVIRSHEDIDAALKWWLSLESHSEGVYGKLAKQYLAKDNHIEKGNLQKSKTDTRFSYILLLTSDGRKKQPKALLIDTKRSKLSSPNINCNIGPEYAACSGTISKAPYLFLCGGVDRSARCLCKLDVVKNKWKSCKKMQNGRSRHIVEMVSEKVYVVGGCHGGKTLSSIEEYDPEKNAWAVMADLVYPVRSAMSAVYGGKLYVFGGKLSNNMPISSIQCLDPSTNTVECAGELPVACSCGSAVVCGENIFIATGSGELLLYDPEHGVTETCARQLTGRKHFGMYLSDGKIYIAGGILDTESGPDQAPNMDSVDMYDATSNRWSRCGWSINEQMRNWSIPKLMPIFSTCQIAKYKPFQTGFGYTETKEVDLDGSS